MSAPRPAPSSWFWPVQLAAWALYAVQQYVAGLGALGHAGVDMHVYTLLDASTGLVLSSLLRVVFLRTWAWPLPWRAVVGAVAVLVAAALYCIASLQLCPTCQLPGKMLAYVLSYGQCLYLLLAWCGGYLGVKFAFAMQHEREQTLHARAAAQQAQLRMLRFQLNPHFLFNALNALSTRMIERDDAEGEQIIDALAGFLRYSLDAEPEQDVPLSEEIEAMRRYLAIEQARFRSRLRVTYDVDPAAVDARVPGLVLQPLMENAVKHGIAPREDGGHIQVRIRMQAGRVTIEIRDDGDGSEDYGASGAGRGVGLGNVRERLRVRFGDRQRFEMVREAQGTCARVVVPFEPMDPEAVSGQPLPAEDASTQLRSLTAASSHPSRPNAAAILDPAPGASA